MYITEKSLKKALKKAFKKGQLDQLVRGRPYTENGYYHGRLAKLGSGQLPIVQQYLKK